MRYRCEWDAVRFQRLFRHFDIVARATVHPFSILPPMTITQARLDGSEAPPSGSTPQAQSRRRRACGRLLELSQEQEEEAGFGRRRVRRAETPFAEVTRTLVVHAEPEAGLEVAASHNDSDSISDKRCAFVVDVQAARSPLSQAPSNTRRAHVQPQPPPIKRQMHRITASTTHH